MRTTRRDLLKFGALATAAAALPSMASSSGAQVPVGKAAKPLNILILGGTGFTGPFQVNYALARGHKVTLFNRGKRPSPEWPGEVEQLFGDRNNDLKSLEAELQRAKIVESRDVPKNVVTMNTRLRFVDLDDRSETEVTLVFPNDANISEGKMSVFSPIGTALLGYAKGDVIEWTVPSGTRRIQITDILYQPEAAGDLHL